jgi:signal transduction histidine kinase
MRTGRQNAALTKNLELALRSMIHRLNRATTPWLQFSFEFDPSVRSVPEDAGSAAYLIVREAVINTLKHSTARNGKVSLAVRDRALLLRVEDDGLVTAWPPHTCSGLINMITRASEQGGWCTFGPQYPRGFAVIASLPLPGDWHGP